MKNNTLDICLMNMPYFSLTRANPGLGIIKAVLNAAGITSKVLYENIHFADTLGLERYLFGAFDAQRYLFGEWTFAQAAFPGSVNPEDDNIFLEKIIELNKEHIERFEYSGDIKEYLREIRSIAVEYINDLAEKVLSLQPKIVGCSSVFFQHTASLALLWKLRELDSSVITLMGGAHCETIMGHTTHKCFPWVDYIVSGECDTIIADLVNQMLDQGRDIPAEELAPGVLGPVHRINNYENTPGATPRQVVADLNEVPIPDYEDFFDALGNSSIGQYIQPALPLESSRGCWWGAKHQCKFCGMNQEGITFRKKNPDRVIDEINQFENKYGVTRFISTDCILSLDYYKTLLPHLANDGVNRDLYFEVKSNTSKEQLQLLKESDVIWLQPGIESLLSDVLSIMNKGVKAYQNIQLLKWGRELGMRISWIFLWGFPEEEDDRYFSLKSIVPLIEHLQPPAYLSRIQIHRYNYYFNNSREIAIPLRPIPVYSYIYDLEEEDLRNLSYCFLPVDWHHTFDDPKLTEYEERPGIQAAAALMDNWRSEFWKTDAPVLSMNDSGEHIDILDTRNCAVQRTHRLLGLQRQVYLLTEEAPFEEKIGSLLNERFNTSYSEEEIYAVLEELCEKKLTLKIDDHVIALAVPGELPSIPLLNRFPGGFIEGHPTGFNDLFLEKSKKQ
ncbi:MAG: RiPP maturation radical SAM protein 1 [bacterium]|nr:RiPP maturation radical SAM protein 1 [bacterium]